MLSVITNERSTVVRTSVSSPKNDLTFPRTFNDIVSTIVNRSERRVRGTIPLSGAGVFAGTWAVHAGGMSLLVDHKGVLEGDDHGAVLVVAGRLHRNDTEVRPEPDSRFSKTSLSE